MLDLNRAFSLPAAGGENQKPAFRQNIAYGRYLHKYLKAETDDLASCSWRGRVVMQRDQMPTRPKARPSSVAWIKLATTREDG